MTPSCTACGAEASLSFVATDRNRNLSMENFRYFRCGSCRLLFLSPIPADLAHYYPKTYYGEVPTLDDLSIAARQDRYKLALFQRLVPSGHLLEIGPAYGAFALLARRAGYDVECLEFDADCVQYLQQVIGVRAIRSEDTAATLESLKGAFDVICMWQNLEHLPEPRRVIRAAADRLKPGGLLVVSTPNPGSFQFRVFGSTWTHVDAPRHLQLIPIPLLRDWAGEGGLVPRLLTARDPGSRGWNRFGWATSLANLADYRLVRMLLRLFGVGIWLLAMPFELAGTRGSCYTAIFSRDRS